LDRKLCSLARALRSWHANCVGSIRFQLAAARLIIYEFDVAQESHSLSPGELELHRELKAHVPGLALMARCMARQRARTRHLRESDACTRYFHLMACHRRRKNYLLAISHNGQTFSGNEAKANVVYSYYNDLLGTAFVRSHRVDLTQLNLPRLDLSELVLPFTVEEVAKVMRETPADRALGPDGFCGGFNKAAWEIVGADVVQVFHALWDMDFRNFNNLNEAIMVLIHKTQAPTGLRDYRPISLIHSIGKLFAKALALRLAPRMPEIIRANQTAFIRGRRIHENFRAVQLICRWLHDRHILMIMLKVDLAKAFDTVA
jgi:hypothetical protein